MKRRSDETREPSDLDLRAQEAAYLRGQYGMSQEDIGKVLGMLYEGRPMSQPRVSRVLERAQALKCFEEIARFVRTADITDDRMIEIRGVLAPPELTNALAGVQSATGVRVRNVRVLASGIEPAPTNEQADLALKKFGSMAAGRIEELIRASKILGITWGRTIGRVIENLSASWFDKDRLAVCFVPVCADPQFQTQFSSTRLVDLLNDIVTNGRGVRLSLAGIPEFYSLRFKGKRQAIQELSRHHTSYQKIFAAKRPLITRLDSLLTGVGIADRPLGQRNQILLAMGELSASALRELVVGDIGGVLIPRPGLNAAGRRRVEGLNAMWTGIRLDHIRRVADQAARSGKPGVIVAAIGRRRAEIVSEIVRCGLVNELIIDEDLSQHLRARLDGNV